MTATTLSQALERATRALQADDALSAADALREASLACEAALRTELGVAVESLGPLQQLHARCCVAADGARRRLAAALGAVGGARRAVAAYRR